MPPSPLHAAPGEAEHRTTTLAWLLFGLLLVTIAYDLYYLVTDPEYVTRAWRFVLVRDGGIVTLLLLNWRGWTRLAAVGAVAVIPLGVATRLLTGLAPLPTRTLSYLVLDVVIASVLFGERGTMAVAAINIVVLVAAGQLVPALDVDSVVGYSALSLIVGGLLSGGIRFRRRIELARRAELLASEGRKSAILATALDSIISADRLGRIIEFNPAAERTFGHRRAEALGRELAEVVIPERDRAAHRAGLQRYLTTGTPRMLGRRLEMSALRADGTEFPCEVAIAVSGQGDDLLFTAYLRDVTERNEAQSRHARLEEQLRESQKMQAVGQLAGGVAHDFNNTLQAVGGYLSFALEDARIKAPELAPDLEAAEQATQRAAGFVRQLLAFSRRQALDLRPSPLNDLIAGFLPLVRRAMSEQITLHFHAGAHLPLVEVDQGQIQQVVLNLCLNARDAMPGGGTLTLETELVAITEAFAEANPWATPGAFVALTVSDSGTGMTPEVRTRMFEPFFSTKGVDRGTGLGLAVVYGIVEQHRGFLHVDSTPALGTSVRMYLPTTSEPAWLDVPAAGAVGGTETILLADDAEAVRDVARRTLQAAGYRVLVATNGQDAVDQFERNPGAIDLALLDAVMPRLGGRAALTAMRALRPDLPALFVSGYSADAIDAAWLEQVGAEFAMKPIAPAELLRRVRRVLDAAIRQRARRG